MLVYMSVLKPRSGPSDIWSTNFLVISTTYDSQSLQLVTENPKHFR